ncbi:Isoprenylcysteine carboxyl methyltransferase, partial [Rhizoclosmatium globosum]
TGCITVLLFQSLRSLAMMTAGANFTHLISFRKEHNHVLVTDGIYSILRHPSYTAFFYWAVILQGGVMKNPVACLGYCVAQQVFVNRIRIEEDTLVHFFGPQYEEYRKRSWVFIPGVWN